MSADKPDPKNDPPVDGEGFLTRWSRLKRKAEPSHSAAALPPDDGVAADPAPVAVAETSLDLSKLPKIEDLTAGSDYKAFLQSGVPAELQRAALRKAWSLDPAIRDFVEVAENQYDWNAPNGVPGFGPLAPGTDIAALLKQAIGAVADTEESQGAATKSDSPEAQSSESPVTLAQDAEQRVGETACDERRMPTIVSDTVAHETSQQSAMARVSEHEVTASHNAPVRRHGSALPKLRAQHFDRAK